MSYQERYSLTYVALVEEKLKWLRSVVEVVAMNVGMIETAASHQPTCNLAATE